MVVCLELKSLSSLSCFNSDVCLLPGAWDLRRISEVSGRYLVRMEEGGRYMPREFEARADNRVNLWLEKKDQIDQVKAHWLGDL